jgi:C_GCAxxG_C_C family probable redox protein
MAYLSAEEAKAEALARFGAAGAAHINCGQAVFVYALLRLDEDPEKITEAKYFGGGITGMGEICGALNGAVLALGVRDVALAERGLEPPADTADQLKAMLRDFTEAFGGRRCLDLTGYDLTTPDGMAAFRMSDIHSRCADYVAWAIDRVEPLLAPALA